MYREKPFAGLADAVYYGSGTVGAACNFNTDCVTQSTMYCNVGACACYSDYTAYQGYCYASKKTKREKGGEVD